MDKAGPQGSLTSEIRKDIHRIIDELGFKSLNKFRLAVLDKFTFVTD